MKHRVLHMASTKQAVAVLSISFVGCSSSAPDPPAETAWGAATVVEELSIGVEAGADEYMFGGVFDLAVASDGTIFVSDRRPRQVRAYDAQGSFLRGIGRQGQGPGEYGASPALEVLPDGMLALWDYRASRVSILTPEGLYLDSFGGTPGFGCDRCLQKDIDGNLYVRVFNRESRSESDRVLLKYSREGEELEHIFFPPADQVGRTFVLGTERVRAFQVMTVTAWSPLGHLVTARNDRYELEVQRPPGAAYLSRDLDVVDVGSEEAAEWEAFRQSIFVRARERGEEAQIDPVPETKPFIREIYVGEEGRIWVHRYVEAEKRHDIGPLPERPERPVLTWREPMTYDVFEPDGTFLGSVVVPDQFRPMVIRGTQLWGAQLGFDSVERVLRLRVVPETQ